MHGTIDWRIVDEKLRRLAGRKGAYDLEEGKWLLAALRAGVHAKVGYGTFAEYVDRLFGYKPRFTGERIRVAEALEDLPATEAALGEGALCWSAVRELSRVATFETEAAWIEAARGKTVRQVEELVSGHQIGDRPGDAKDPRIERRVLRFEVSAETFAEFREAQAKVEREAGQRLDDDEALRQIARQILGGPKDEGRASYQIAMTVCPECGRGHEQSRGELVEVGPEVVEMAECDAQHIGSPHVGSPEQSPHVGSRDRSTHVGRNARATQTIPPATRRQIVRRDYGRCTVPGCRCTQFLDIHHLRPRAEGGTHDPETMVLLCGAHHRAVHRGFLIIEGSAPDALRFHHADGTAYGSDVPRAEPVARAADAFRALKQLGFPETRARAAVDAAVTHVGIEAPLADLIRAALAETRREIRPTIRDVPAGRAPGRSTRVVESAYSRR